MKRKVRKRVMALAMALLMPLSCLTSLGGVVLEVKAEAVSDFAGWNENISGANAAGTITKGDSGNVTLVSTGGKIASGNDGIVFLNKQLDNATDDFILQATVKVDDYEANNQAAFGLMMRPAVGEGSKESDPFKHVFVGMLYQAMCVSNRTGATNPARTPFSSVSLATNTNYEMTLQKVGSNITAVINGEVISSVSINSNDGWDQGLYVGLFTARKATAEFSNVRLATKSADDTVKVQSQTAPDKTNYIVGNSIADIDLTGFSAEVMIGETTKTITGSDCIIKEFDSSTQGSGKIVLEYLGEEIDIEVNFDTEKVTDVTITYPPTKTDYFVGDPLDWTGLEGTVTYNSGITKDLKKLIDDKDSETTIEGNTSAAGKDQTITIKHEHGGETKSASFKINVSDAALTGISLSGPNQTRFYVGVEPKANAYKDGLKVTANFSDGSKEVITDSAKFKIDPDQNVNTTSVGEQKYTVSYSVGSQTQTADYTLTVVDDVLKGIVIATYPDKTTFAKGESFVSTGLVVKATYESGQEKTLGTGEYTIDSTKFNGSTAGSYTITISYQGFSTSYVATVAEKTSFGYGDLQWNSTVFGQSAGTGHRPSVTDGKIIVEQAEGEGKVTDAGQDGIAYYYTSVNPDQNFVFEADVTVNYFVTKSAPDNQEGFGLMVRDALGPDNDKSVFYSSAATVGGYYGRYNVFGRYGITDEDTASFTNFYQYVKTNQAGSHFEKDKSHFQIKENDTKTFHMIIAKDNTGIWASMTENGTDVLAQSANGSDGGLNVHFNEPAAGQYRVYMPTDTFTSVDPNKIYLGFMTARGAKITVDPSTIKLKVTAAESDAPQQVLPAAPIVPEVSITSLNTSSTADYDLKVKVNAPGLLTVKVNGKVEAKQDEVTAGTQTYPVTLNEGNNAVQLTFEPDGSAANLADTKTLTVNGTIVFKQYGDVETAIFASPTGQKSAAGTKEDPLELQTAIDFVQAGQFIYLLEGTYDYSGAQIPHGNNGTEDKLKHLYAYPENKGAVVFDLGGKSSNTFAVSGDYWYVEGIEVTNGGGLRVGGNHNVIDSCKTYKNVETGLQISRTDSASSIEDWPSYNTILNCDSYLNRDESENNADGFAAKLTSGVGNSFIGCIAYYNVDDGWDLFAKAQPIGAVVLKDCVSYGNGLRQINGELQVSTGDGNGFKLGGSGVPVAHEIYNSYAFGNKANGFTNNSDPMFKAVDCVSYNNVAQNLELHAYTTASEEFVVEGFASFRDNTITDFKLYTDKTSFSNDISSVRDKSPLQKPENYLYDKSKNQCVNSEGVALTAENFESLSDFVPYLSLEKQFERDANGNIVFNGYMQFKTPKEDEPGTPGSSDAQDDDDDDDDNLTLQEEGAIGKVEAVEKDASGKEVRRLTNRNMSHVISIVGGTKMLPSGAYYTSQYQTGGSHYDKAVAAVKSKLMECSDYRVIDINLYDANNVAIHRLGGMVNVELRMPDGFKVRDGYVIVVYRLNDN
ncbi:MAG: bacterial Ig-like domain-containing protein, partial [Acetatifactor sp.]|nr:bacterial Ig-like domain-containing protein [Acetatifactor sp.]